MFLRILTKATIHRRNRLAVAAIALVVGSTVTTAMLSVYYDAGRKMSRELRAYGANIMIGPKEGATFDQKAMDGLTAGIKPAEIVAAAPFLYVVAQVTPKPASRGAAASFTPGATADQRAVVVTGTWLDQARKVSPWWQVKGDWFENRDDDIDCLVGAHLAGQLGVNQNDWIEVAYGAAASPDNTNVTEHEPLRVGSQAGIPAPGSGATESARSAPGGARAFRVAGIIDSGGPEDDQVIVSLNSAQRLAGLQGRLSAVAVSASGGPGRVEALAASIDSGLDGVRADVVRQIAESEGRILGRLRLTMLLVALLILIAASLSVGTTLTALVMDRRKEIGTMKAIGAEGSDLLRLFLFELGGLGLGGGIVGYALGMAVAQPIGRSMFNSAVTPRIVVFIIILVVSLGVAMLSGILPIRRMREIEPAIILKGD
jgi:putative ABC transport system permease protein